jgi:hypothetical protein
VRFLRAVFVRLVRIVAVVVYCIERFAASCVCVWLMVINCNYVYGPRRVTKLVSVRAFHDFISLRKSEKFPIGGMF